MTFEDLMGYHYSGDDDVIKELYKDNQDNFAELKKQLKKHNVIPVFGAGFSGGAYPGWGTLLRGMAAAYPECKDPLEQHLKAGQYEEAASLLCGELGDHDFRKKLVKVFGRDTLPEAMTKISSERKSINTIFSGPMMTTNVEQVLEEIFKDQRPMVVCPHTTYQQPQVNQALQAGASILLKLHGDIDDSKHLVFTKEAYEAVYGEQGRKPFWFRP